jgi:hypothetical protein
MEMAKRLKGERDQPPPNIPLINRDIIACESHVANIKIKIFQLYNSAPEFNFVAI